MQQAAPVVAVEHAIDDVAERRILRGADVLEHADRHEGIAPAVDRSIVVAHESHEMVKALAGRARFLANSSCSAEMLYARTGDAVVPRHVQRQRAPAAARLDDVFAGLKPQLAAHVVELRALGVLERRVRPVVVRARIDEVRVEPEPVKVVAQIVVRERCWRESARDTLRSRRPPRW